MATIGSVTSNTSNGADTLSCTATGSAGDLLIAVCTWHQVRSWSSGMSGWTQLGSGDYTSSIGTYYFRSRIFYKTHSGSESNPSFTISASTYIGMCIIPITGVTVDDLPAAPTASSFTTAQVSTAGYTTTESDAVVVFVTSGVAGTSGYTNSGTSTTRLLHDADGDYRGVFVGTKVVATPGTYGAEQFATRDPGDYHYRLALVLEAASAPPTISSVTLTGTSQIGNTLTATVVTDQDPVDSTAYRWQTASDGSGTGAADISGETASTLSLTYADFGSLLDTAAYVRCGAIATKNSLPSDEAFSAWQQVTVAAGGGFSGSPLKSPFLIA